eukprot:687542-Rhodomonas_salina.2
MCGCLGMTRDSRLQVTGIVSSFGLRWHPSLGILNTCLSIANFDTGTSFYMYASPGKAFQIGLLNVLLLLHRLRDASLPHGLGPAFLLLPPAHPPVYLGSRLCAVALHLRALSLDCPRGEAIRALCSPRRQGPCDYQHDFPAHRRVPQHLPQMFSGDCPIMSLSPSTAALAPRIKCTMYRSRQGA